MRLPDATGPTKQIRCDRPEQADRMRLEGIDLRWLTLRLRTAIRTSAGTHNARPVAFVRVVTDEGEGWGECAALADGTSVDPDLATVWRHLVDAAVPSLLARLAAVGGRLPDIADRPGAAAGEDEPAGLVPTPDGPTERFAAAALEMAMLDTALRARGTSLAEWLGADRRWVHAGTVAGIPDNRDIGRLREQVRNAVGRGFRRVRVKIEPGWDVVPLTALRRDHPALRLQADANGAYRMGGGDAADASHLSALDELDLDCIEQPFPPGSLSDSAELGRQIATPVCLDEDLTTVERLEAALASGACQVACLKPARLGGLAAARRAHDICRRAGVAAFVGGFFETGLGRAANAAVAALPAFSIDGDVSPASGYLLEDPCGMDAAVGQAEPEDRVQVWAAPGVGPRPDPAGLRRHTREGLWFPVRR